MDEAWVAVFLMVAISAGLIISVFGGILVFVKLNPMLSPALPDEKNVIFLAAVSMLAVIFVAWSFRDQKKIVRKRKH